MARASLANLITKVRALSGESGTSPLLTDDQIQSCLDDHCTFAYYQELDALPTVSAGVTSYKTFHSPEKYWEADVVLSKSDGTTLTATTSDPILGRWVFATAQDLPVLATGKYFDIYRAAAQALRQFAATFKEAIDFSSSDQSFKDSQVVKHALEMAADLERMAPAWQGRATRSDAY